MLKKLKRVWVQVSMKYSHWSPKNSQSNRTKINFFTMFFPWNNFLCARIPSLLENGKQIVKVLWEEFRCHLILWVTMWAEFFSHCDSHCEKIVSGDEYPYCHCLFYKYDVDSRNLDIEHRSPIRRTLVLFDGNNWVT